MIYLSAQPAIYYYGWHVETILYNFTKQGINIKDIHIVLCSVNGKIDNYFFELKKRYPTANLFFYSDTRGKFEYISSVRPHVLKKHFKAFPELKNEVIFYHDSDIAFTKPVDFTDLAKDNVNYLSDTISYIGYEYIKSKGDVILQKMLDIVDITEQIVKDNQKNSGGAQYILKNIDYKFWRDVEMDCEKLFVEITELNKKLDNDPPFQIWCADMWAVLWNLWRDGRSTKIHKSLDFAWSVDSIEKWNQVGIYHNAGAPEKNNEYFYKHNYINSLPPKDLNISKNNASYEYYNLIKKALYGESN